MAQHESHAGSYRWIFLTLCGLTIISWIADSVELSGASVGVIVMVVAALKALCVMMVFMHLKFEGSWKYLLLAPTIILAAAIPFALAPDIGLHYYPVDVPQSHVQPHTDHGGHGDHSEPAPVEE